LTSWPKVPYVKGNVFRMNYFPAVLAWLVAAMAMNSAQAQTPSANPAAGADQDIQKRTVEWSVLANNLELRLARLLPCDARAAPSISEAQRASDARMATILTYWQSVAEQSRQQVDAARRALVEQEAQATERKLDVSDAGEEQNAIAARLTELAESSRKAPALAAAKQALDGIAQSSQQSVVQAGRRETEALLLLSDARDALNSAEARQSSIDDAVRSLMEENQRWRLYYAARAVRAQTECNITKQVTPAPAKPRPVPRPSAKSPTSGKEPQ